MRGKRGKEKEGEDKELREEGEDKEVREEREGRRG